MDTSEKSQCIGNKTHKDTFNETCNVFINEAFRRVRVTIVGGKTRKYYKCVSVALIIQHVCTCAVLYCHL